LASPEPFLLRLFKLFFASIDQMHLQADLILRSVFSFSTV
jgi:hypothetical protein